MLCASGLHEGAHTECGEPSASTQSPRVVDHFMGWPVCSLMGAAPALPTARRRCGAGCSPWSADEAAAAVSSAGEAAAAPSAGSCSTRQRRLEPLPTVTSSPSRSRVHTCASSWRPFT